MASRTDAELQTQTELEQLRGDLRRQRDVIDSLLKESERSSAVTTELAKRIESLRRRSEELDARYGVGR